MYQHSNMEDIIGDLPQRTADTEVCHSERVGIGKLLLKPSDKIKSKLCMYVYVYPSSGFFGASNFSWPIVDAQFLLLGYCRLINSIPTQGSSQHPRYWRVNWLNDVKEVESPISPACPNHLPTIGWRERDKWWLNHVKSSYINPHIIDPLFF